MQWTLLVEPGGQPGYRNMMIDVSLLQRAKEGHGFLRLYRWSPACLSFGRNEPALTRYDRDAITKLGIDTVRRPTGGRAVWHDDELTYAVAAPIATLGPLRTSYRAIHTMLVNALRSLGVPAATVPSLRRRTAPLTAGACFAAPVAGEIVVEGRKLVGSAQVQEDTALLQHGSLLLANGQDMVAQVTRGDPPPASATSVSDALKGLLSFDTVADAVIRAAQDTWRGHWRTGDPDRVTVCNGRFTDPAWTWWR